MSRITDILAATTALSEQLGAAAVAAEREGRPPVDDVLRLHAAGVTALTADASAGGAGAGVGTAALAVATVAQGDLAVAVLLAGHLAGLTALRAAGGRQGDAAQRSIVAAGRLVAPAAPGAPVHGAALLDGFVVTHDDHHVLVDPVDARVTVTEAVTRIGLRRIPAAAVHLPGHPASDLLTALRAVLEAAAVVGAAEASIAAERRFTLARRIPRPVPGVTSASGDPLTQVVIGAALGPVAAARALVLRAARSLDAHLDDPALPVPSVEALAALEVALGVGLEQGREVYEVVGTSGSGNAHGFDRLWRDVRTLSLLQPRGDRRRAIGRAVLAAA